MELKLFLLLLLICVALSAAKFQIRTREDALRAHEECREENHVPDEIYEKFLNYEFPEHKRKNCYIKCFVEKLDLFTERRGFNEKNIIAQFTHDNTKNLDSVQHGLEKCIDHNEWDSDVCTWANRVFLCWLEVNRHIVRKMFAQQ